MSVLRRVCILSVSVLFLIKPHFQTSQNPDRQPHAVLRGAGSHSDSPVRVCIMDAVPSHQVRCVGAIRRYGITTLRGAGAAARTEV